MLHFARWRQNEGDTLGYIMCVGTRIQSPSTLVTALELENRQLYFFSDPSLLLFANSETMKIVNVRKKKRKKSTCDTQCDNQYSSVRRKFEWNI